MIKAYVIDTSRSPRARLRPVPATAITLDDAFWKPRIAINRDTILPLQDRRCEESGRLRNFLRAAGATNAPFEGMFFNDSDVYKWLKAATSTLALGSTPELAAMVDTVVACIERAQRPDGYLNTYSGCRAGGPPADKMARGFKRTGRDANAERKRLVTAGGPPALQITALPAP